MKLYEAPIFRTTQRTVVDRDRNTVHFIEAKPFSQCLSNPIERSCKRILSSDRRPYYAGFGESMIEDLRSSLCRWRKDKRAHHPESRAE
jgi:hypothetical protein